MMRWIYRILRLFFCPHKWKNDGTRKLTREGYFAGTVTTKSCRYCGKVRHFKDINY